MQELVEFGYAKNEQDAARLAITAGVTIEMGVQVPSINDTYTKFGPGLVKVGQAVASRRSTTTCGTCCG